MERKLELAMGSQLRSLVEDVLNGLRLCRRSVSRIRARAQKKNLSAKARRQLQETDVMTELHKLSELLGEDAVLNGLTIAENGGVKLRAAEKDVRNQTTPVVEDEKLSEVDEESESDSRGSPDIFEVNLDDDEEGPSKDDSTGADDDSITVYKFLPEGPLRFYEVNINNSSQRSSVFLYESADFCECEAFRTLLSAGSFPFCRHCVAVWLAVAFDWVTVEVIPSPTLIMIHEQLAERVNVFQ